MQHLDIKDNHSILASVLSSTKKIEQSPKSCRIYFDSPDLASNALFTLKKIFSPSLDDLEENVNENFIEMTINQYNKIKQQLRDYAAKIGPKGDFALKALRGDTRCYYRNFVDMVVSPINTKHPLRRGEKKLFTVTGKSIFKRKEFFKENEKFIKKPTLSAAEKAGFSKAQSTSLGLSNYFPKVFGFGLRGERLLGAIVDEEDILYSDRLFIYDGGTVYRPYDAVSLSKGIEYYKTKAKGNKKVLYSKDELVEFKQTISDPKNAHLYNEAMVYMRWNIKTSVLFVASDNLQTRILTQDYARILKEFLLKHNLCDESYTVPICFYDPDHPNNHFKEYSIEEQKLDLLEAREICNNYNLAQQEYAEHQYETLLSLSGDEILKALQNEYNGNMLLLDILANGYIHIFQSLREKTNQEILMKILSQAILEEKCRHLLPDIIYHCFRTKENELANYIYKETQFDTLHFDIDPINNHLIKAVLDDSPECIEKLLMNKSYLAMINEKTPDDKTTESNHTPLTLACSLGHHQSVLKLLEHKELDVNLLAEHMFNPLQIAINAGNYKTAKAILKCDTHKVDINHVNANGDTAFTLAADSGHHLIVKKLLKYYPEVINLPKSEQLNLTLNTLGKYAFIEYAKKGDSILHMGAKKKYALDVIKELLSHKEIDINHKNIKGQTPLMLAVKNGNFKMTKLLLENKNIDITYSLNKGNKYGNKNALYYAMFSSKFDYYMKGKNLRCKMISLLLSKMPVILTDTLHCKALEMLLKNNTFHNEGVKCLTHAINDYISLRYLEPESTFGGIIGIPKIKKIAAAKFLLQNLLDGTVLEMNKDENYPQFKDALMQGRLFQLYSLAQIQPSLPKQELILNKDAKNSPH